MVLQSFPSPLKLTHSVTYPQINTSKSLSECTILRRHTIATNGYSAEESFALANSIFSRRSSNFEEDSHDLFAMLSMRYTGNKNLQPLTVLGNALGNDNVHVVYIQKAQELGYLDEWKSSDWVTLKNLYQEKMCYENLHGISREGLRDHAVKAVQQLVTKYLVDTGAINSGEWLQVGTAGYKSDIDTNFCKFEKGPNFLGESTTCLFSRVLFESCWKTLFGGMSGIQADTEVYTNIKTYQEPTTPASATLHESADLFLALLQLQRCSPEFASGLCGTPETDSVIQQLQDEASAFIEANKQLIEDEVQRDTGAGKSLAETYKMASAKAQYPITQHIAQLQDSLMAEAMEIDIQIRSVSNEETEGLQERRDLLMTQHMLLSGIMSTYFDESYFANASYTSIVLGTQKVRLDAKGYHDAETPHAGITPPTLSDGLRCAAMIENIAMWIHSLDAQSSTADGLIASSKYALRVVNEARHILTSQTEPANEDARKVLVEAGKLTTIAAMDTSLRSMAEHSANAVPADSALGDTLRTVANAGTDSELHNAIRLLRQIISDSDDGVALPLSLYKMQSTISSLEALKRGFRIPTYDSAMHRIEGAIKDTGIQLSNETRLALQKEIQQLHQRMHATYDYQKIVEQESIPVDVLIDLYMSWIDEDAVQCGVTLKKKQRIKLVDTFRSTLGTSHVTLSNDERNAVKRETGISTEKDAQLLLEKMKESFKTFAQEATTKTARNIIKHGVLDTITQHLAPTQTLKSYLPHQQRDRAHLTHFV